MNSTSKPSFTNPRAAHDYKGQSCSILAVGSYVPEKIVRNADLEKIVNTTDEWIVTRTGIRERRSAAPDEFTSDLGAKAALKAMERARITPDQIDLIIVATITPDMGFPSTACLIQHKLGAMRAAAFDLNAACSGFIYAMEVGQQFIMSRTYKTVLVIGCEKLSAITNWEDRNTCVLFGDGAGAAILQHRPGAHGLLTACMGADGSKGELIRLPAGGSRNPASVQTVEQRMHYLHMEGKEVFKSAVTAMCTAAEAALKRCHLDITRIKCVIPHQANRRIIDAVAERLNATQEQLFVNLEKYGNTSAASVAIALDEAVQIGRIQQGDLVLLVAFGAGLTWGAAVIEW